MYLISFVEKSSPIYISLLITKCLKTGSKCVILPGYFFYLFLFFFYFLKCTQCNLESQKFQFLLLTCYIFACVFWSSHFTTLNFSLFHIKWKKNSRFFSLYYSEDGVKLLQNTYHIWLCSSYFLSLLSA